MKKGKIIALLAGFVFILAACGKDCHLCQAYQSFDNRMVDFKEECGSQSEREEMELDFREEYPDSLGYMVICN